MVTRERRVVKGVSGGLGVGGVSVGAAGEVAQRRRPCEPCGLLHTIRAKWDHAPTKEFIRRLKDTI